MKQFVVQVAGPSTSLRVLLSVAENVPSEVIKQAVIKAILLHQGDLFEHAGPIEPPAAHTPAVLWGQN